MLEKNRGSFTLEATIVFPTVFLTVLAVIYFCLMLYQQVYLQTIADKVVKRAANSWSMPGKDMFFGFVSKDDMENNSLYWRIIDTKIPEKKSKIEEYAGHDFDKYSLLNKSTKYKITPDIKTEAVVYKKITIDIESDYKNPVGNLLKGFGFEGILNFKVHADAIVNEPSEFIRNTDFVLDTVREYTGQDMGDITKSMNETITMIFSKINDFAGKK